MTMANDELGDGARSGKMNRYSRPAAATRTRFVIKPSRQTCLVLGSITGVVVAASIGLYVWQMGEIDALAQKVHQKETDLANSVKISHDLQTVTDENTRTRSELRYLETSVTQGEYVPTLLHQAEDLARSTQLKVSAIRPTLEPAPTPPTDKEAAKKFVPQPYDKLHVDMDISGHYWNLAQMLYKLTEFPKIMTVESVEMTPGNSTPTDHSLLNVRLRLTGFIFKADPASAPDRPAVPGTPAVAAPGTARSAARRPAALHGKEGA